MDLGASRRVHGLCLCPIMKWKLHRWQRQSREEAPRSCGQPVISSEEIGSMGRKSRGRGRDGPVWEVQYKQSLFFNHPGSRSQLDTLWCSPRAAPPPSHPRLPSNCAEPFGETCWYQPQSVVGPSRYGEAEGQWEWDERMWSGAGLTAVQSIAWKAFIIADVLQETV